ncbi:hypothetical protein BCV70DRAFT_76987 [Testicularia cyperi]|uniref:Uncharacterized protein n=1 Tax=Testicularia cyperi TaxID=1882483 RepID=A0A317XTB3_9BASI|nr:hypothetical protein BCV70DRAFT_76987 [Testicularia cyperi]
MLAPSRVARILSSSSSRWRCSMCRANHTELRVRNLPAACDRDQPIIELLGATRYKALSWARWTSRQPCRLRQRCRPCVCRCSLQRRSLAETRPIRMSAHATVTQRRAMHAAESMMMWIQRTSAQARRCNAGLLCRGGAILCRKQSEKLQQWRGKYQLAVGQQSR